MFAFFLLCYLILINVIYLTCYFLLSVNQFQRLFDSWNRLWRGGRVDDDLTRGLRVELFFVRIRRRRPRRVGTLGLKLQPGLLLGKLMTKHKNFRHFEKTFFHFFIEKCKIFRAQSLKGITGFVALVYFFLSINMNVPIIGGSRKYAGLVCHSWVCGWSNRFGWFFTLTGRFYVMHKYWRWRWTNET